jgi:hypothetical protein
MTAPILRAMPLVEMVVPKLRTVYRGFLHALDAFAEARMRNAVPEWQLRKAQRRGQSLSLADARRSQIAGEDRTAGV